MKVSFQVVCGNAPTLLYQGNNLQTLVVTNFIVSNSDAGNANISIFLVAPGASPAITDAVIHLVKLSGNTYIQGNGGFVVPPKYAVYVQSTTNNLVIATIGGDLLVNT
jgi:hypothetical protein